MEVKRGIPVSHGVAIGRVFVIENAGARIGRKYVMPDEVHREIERFDHALAQSHNEIGALNEKLRAQISEGYKVSDIFMVHQGILNDPKLREQVVNLITNKLFTSEYAVSQVLRRYSKSLEEAGDTYLLQRVRDFDDIEQRLLRNLTGGLREDLDHLNEPVIVIAHDLTPSQTAGFDRERVLGIATEAGGRTSHTAILARALGIPAVVGVGELLSAASEGDLVIVDGARGEVVISPDEVTRHRYEMRGHTLEVLEEKIAAEFCNLPAITRDGRRIDIEANIEFPYEVASISQHGAEGVGLYRTEFLYHAAESPPDEETHFRAYMEAIRALHDKPMTIRVLDLGADKFPSGFPERNPFLGCRSMRLMRLHKQVFRHQIRAILRASAIGNIRFMFPLICTLQELREARAVVTEMMKELDESNILYNKNIKIGMMIEVPSAAVMADRFVQESDFFSIGTNDLTQYALAVDRDNEHVAHLYSPVDPAVLRMMRMTQHAARKGAIDCSICGEMAGDLLYTMLLVGMGFTSLSMVSTAIPDVKKLVRSISYEDAQRVAEKALEMSTAQEVQAFLEQETRRVVPEMLEDA